MSPQPKVNGRIAIFTETVHCREIAAKGIDNVESSMNHSSSNIEFKRVSTSDKEELNRVQGLIPRLLSAAKIIDEKHLREDKERHVVDKVTGPRENCIRC